MGSYAESLLTPDEKILKRERQHWLALILDSWLAIILWGITIILIVVRILLPDEFYFLSFTSDSWFGTIGTSLTLITLVAGIIVVAIRWWWWQTQEFLVTNRRLVLAWGILSKSASDSSLEKINDAQLEISLMGRMLDYGHLKVLTAAPLQGADYLDRLAHAKQFKKIMMTAKHDLQTTERGDGEDYGALSSADPRPLAAAASPPPVADAPAIPPEPATAPTTTETANPLATEAAAESLGISESKPAPPTVNPLDAANDDFLKGLE
jgi:hypothetical protein